MVVQKLEIAFDSTPNGDYFVLDDATHGLLDNTTYVLGSSTFYDITEHVVSVKTSRGKNRQLDRFNAGHLQATVMNVNRFFDPTFEASPFYGQIVPRRNIQYSVDGVVQFYGVVDDWNLSYSPDGLSIADVSAYDGFSYLANQTLSGGTQTVELSGARINAVLSDPLVAWPYNLREVDAGQETMQADVVAANQNAMAYINIIEQTEPGMFFIGKTGNAVWRDRTNAHPVASVPVVSDDGTGIGYSSVKVVYGSELLYNQAILSRNGGGTAISNAYLSQSTYGIRALKQDKLLMNTDAALSNLAGYLTEIYKEPEFRFEAMDFVLSDKSDADRAALLGLEIGDICQIKFTPNGIPPAIEKYGVVIGMSNSGSLDNHVLTLNFETVETSSLLLDDPVYGLLDFSLLSY